MVVAAALPTRQVEVENTNPPANENPPADVGGFFVDQNHPDFNPYWPFPSEQAEVDYRNALLEIHCDMIMTYDGRGICGSEKFQHIKEVYLAAKGNDTFNGELPVPHWRRPTTVVEDSPEDELPF